MDEFKFLLFFHTFAQPFFPLHPDDFVESVYRSFFFREKQPVGNFCCSFPSYRVSKFFWPESRIEAISKHLVGWEKVDGRLLASLFRWFLMLFKTHYSRLTILRAEQQQKKAAAAIYLRAVRFHSSKVLLSFSSTRYKFDFIANFNILPICASTLLLCVCVHGEKQQQSEKKKKIACTRGWSVGWLIPNSFSLLLCLCWVYEFTHFVWKNVIRSAS